MNKFSLTKITDNITTKNYVATSRALAMLRPRFWRGCHLTNFRHTPQLEYWGVRGGRDRKGRGKIEGMKTMRGNLSFAA